MELWTKAHAQTILPALAVMVLLAILLRRWLGGKSLSVRLLPIRIIACLLVVLEIGKQGLSLYRGYDLYCLPFHFCSLFIFALPVMAFYTGKHRQSVYGVVSALCGAMTLLFLIYPNLIYSAANVENYFRDYMSFHTVTFHNLVMLAFLLILALQIQSSPVKGEVGKLMLVIVVFCVVSAAMAHLLKTNYANYYSCNIPVLEAVRLDLQSTLGYVLTQILYVSIVSALNLVFVWGSYWAYRGLRRLTQHRVRVS